MLQALGVPPVEHAQLEGKILRFIRLSRIIGERASLLVNHVKCTCALFYSQDVITLLASCLYVGFCAFVSSEPVDLLVLAGDAPGNEQLEELATTQQVPVVKLASASAQSTCCSVACCSRGKPYIVQVQKIYTTSAGMGHALRLHHYRPCIALGVRTLHLIHPFTTNSQPSSQSSSGSVYSSDISADW